MNYLKIILAVLSFFVVFPVSAKKNKDGKSVQQTVYIVGVASSFNDSIAYCTDIQELSDITLDRKRYLHRRSGYSFQLRDYLLGQGRQNYTCLVLFNTKKVNLEKDLAKIKTRFAKNKLLLREIQIQEFKFTKPEEL